MVPPETINAAVHILVEAAAPARIVMFGSHARGDAQEDSDLDLLVIEPRVENRAREMVRRRRLLRPLRIPVDILVDRAAASRIVEAVIAWAELQVATPSNKDTRQ
jgi:predicted nucleotidyltransferase